MLRLGKRALLRQAAWLGSAALVWRAVAANAPGADSWSVDAGAVKVMRGPWPGSEYVVPGVHFENLLLRMPDGVYLNAILYIPTTVRSGARVGTQLTSDPYRT